MNVSESVPARRVRALVATLPLDSRDRPWTALAVLPAVVAVAVYLATNPYPAYGAGLYAQIAAELAANGYAPPARIPGYTADGVPFAYPPVQFYLFAVLLDLGGDPVDIARFLPSVAVIAAQIPIYVLARDAIGSRRAGAVAAAMVALNPQVLEWHISAGGVVRAFAFLYATTSICAGYRAFTTGSGRATAVGLLAFGLTVLAHPTYALFVVVSYLLFWGVLDRSLPGLLRGAIVGVGGLVLASPWLGWAVATHGLDVFTAAAGTHGGVGGGLSALTGELSVFTLVPLGAAAYLLAARRTAFLAVWVLAAEFLFAQPRFAYAVGAIALAAVAFDLVERFSLSDALGGGRVAGIDRSAAVVALVLLVGTVAGGSYLAYEMSLETDPSTPEFLDGEDAEAIRWAETETPADATFVVLGDAAEWFPALSDRTILIGPWGVEWESAAAFDRQIDAYESVSACQSASCVERASESVGGTPDYVYVPKGQYTIRGQHTVQFGTLERSFERSPRWVEAYENDGVAVYRRADDSRS